MLTMFLELFWANRALGLDLSLRAPGSCWSWGPLIWVSKNIELLIFFNPFGPMDFSILSIYNICRRIHYHILGIFKTNLKILIFLYFKKCKPWSEGSVRSALIWVYTFCIWRVIASLGLKGLAKLTNNIIHHRCSCRNP